MPVKNKTCQRWLRVQHRKIPQTAAVFQMMHVCFIPLQLNESFVSQFTTYERAFKCSSVADRANFCLREWCCFNIRSSRSLERELIFESLIDCACHDKQMDGKYVKQRGWNLLEKTMCCLQQQIYSQMVDGLSAETLQPSIAPPIDCAMKACNLMAAAEIETSCSWNCKNDMLKQTLMWKTNNSNNHNYKLWFVFDSVIS